MAKSRDNVVMQGASGKIGRTLVFRQRGDKTIIAKAPKRRPGGKPFSEAQLAAQQRFLDASIYAQAAIGDPLLKQAYTLKANVNQSAYNVAFKDFMSPPEVRRLDDRAYTGQIGETLDLLVRDILKVTQVHVAILGAGDAVIEEGSALSMDDGGVKWTYTATEEHPDIGEASYRITMIDTPGHVTVVSITYGEGMVL